MKARSGNILPLALAHFSCDLGQGALPVLLPFFMTAHHITYAAAATIVFAANLASTATQPVFGYIADRQSRPWLIPLGVLIAGLGFSFAGVVPGYGMVLLVVAVSGLGVATFHPEGARQAHRLAGDRRATTMSLFTFGGQLGFALGPLFATVILLAWGLQATLLFALPAVAIAAFVFLTPGRSSSWAEHAPERQSPGVQGAGTDAWPAFFCVAAAVICRSTIFYGLNTFIPLFWMNVLQQSAAAGGSALAILVAGGIAGNLIGGRLADRFGYRTAALVEFGLLACLLPLLLFTHSPLWAFALLVPIGLLLSAPNSAMVVLGQTYLPNHVGFSSGVTMGLAFSFGGMMTPLIGWIADGHGLRTAISSVAFLPIISAGLLFLLPAGSGLKERAGSAQNQ
jgi:MFS transporter, FSR family, fosmidomycin resistance protein